MSNLFDSGLKKECRPSIPANVARLLRQESAFGCAKCGHPYIEYHHIIPYCEDNHFRPNDMVALCPNCHASVSVLSKEEQYLYKNMPHNKRHCILNGALSYTKKDMSFLVGNIEYENTPILVQYQDRPIISCSIEDKKAMLDINFLDQYGNELLVIKKNEISFRVENFWDFEYKHNYVVARHKAREIALEIDLRTNPCTIFGKMWVGSRRIDFGKMKNTYGSNTFSGKISNCSIGLQLI